MMHIFFKLLLIAAFIPSTLWAHTAQLRVKGKLVESTVELEHLVSNSSFEGKYFTILEAGKDSPVQFSDNEALVKRASNVYYHLNVARNYFVQMNKNIAGFNPEKHINIRIEQDKNYDEYFHFAENQKDNGSGSLAGALTITEDKYNLDPEHSWNNEIWFFKKTVFKAPATVSKIGGAFNQSGFKSPLRQTLMQTELNAWLSSESMILNYTGFTAMDLHASNTISHLSSMIIPLALIEVVPFVLSKATKNIKKELYMETSSIPEVIYHEYSHYALKGIFDLDKNSSLSEAYANYFAYKISGMTKIGEAKNFSNISPKDAKSKGLYGLNQEYSAYAAYGNFTFSVLYSTEQALGLEGESVVINALDYLDSTSNLKSNLPAAFLTVVGNQSKDKSYQTRVLLQSLRKKGL